jgi:hypothetical protein
VIAEEALVVAEVRRDVLVGIEYREEGHVEIRNAAQQVGGAGREPAILLDELP